MGQMPTALAWLQPLHGGHPQRRRHRPQDHRRAHGGAELRAREPHYRPRPGWVDGDQEARGLLLMLTADESPVDSPVVRLADDIDAQIEQQLAADRAKDLLRFSTAGSVDDGKST